jgi:lipoic acid synthetase
MVHRLVVNIVPVRYVRSMAGLEQKPSWLRRRLPPEGQNTEVMSTLKGKGLHTVCIEARCPNQLECFSRGTATFLLLGPNCTRACTFCVVNKLPPIPPDDEEPEQTARAVAELGLDFCVLTMVTRDDIPDGGAGHIARTVKAVKEYCNDIGVEVLVSDLGGKRPALEAVLFSSPEVLAHNVETVPRLYLGVRPQADYYRSLELLSRAAEAEPEVVTKSGLMLGLGEEKDEVLGVMDDLRSAGCKLLTLGQYLAPSRLHHPVVEYIHPDVFGAYEQEAYSRGFRGVASAPFVRSSYNAGEMYKKARV